MLVEIQTKNFLKLKPKLKKLLGKYKVRVIHNIPSVKWLLKIDENGEIISKRKSTKKGTLYNIFDELIYLIDVVNNPKFSLEILITEEEEIRCDDGRGSWRRKGVSIKDRMLVKIIDKKKINRLVDFLKILPEMKEPFSTKDIAEILKINIYLARKVLYFYKKTKLIKCTGRKGNLLLYKIVHKL